MRPWNNLDDAKASTFVVSVPFVFIVWGNSSGLPLYGTPYQVFCTLTNQQRIRPGIFVEEHDISLTRAISNQ